MNAAIALLQPPLVSTRWLAARANATRVRVLDVRCPAGTSGSRDLRGPSHREEDIPCFVELGAKGGFARMGHWPTVKNTPFAAGHVPGSVFFDVAHRSFDASGRIVSAAEMAMAMSQVGVGDEDTVVLVDDGRPSAGLALAWALQHYGHADTFLLDGGFPRWQEEGRPVTTDVVRRPFASFTARVG